MGFTVIWSPRALDSLEAIVSRISQDNPAAALAMGNRLVDKSLSLGSFPQLGAIFKEPVAV